MIRVASWKWLWSLIAALWLAQACTLGISDDEAYYWVLSKTPALGYVYHPPLVAWSIALFHLAFSWIPGIPREALTRAPGLAYTLFTFFLAIQWVRDVRQEEPSSMQFAWLVIPGLAGIGWMMVPDHSLFLGWMISFYASWKIITGDSRPRWLMALTLGIAVGMLSKFSAVLYVGSAAASVILFSRRRLLPLLAVSLGVTLAVIPILYWNWRNEWVALLYQFHSRHSGSGWNGKRYATFWITQLLLAGPALAWATVLSAGAALQWKQIRAAIQEWHKPTPGKFVFLWFLPAAIFLVQPAFSEFKPHWAIIAWFPLALAQAIQRKPRRWLDKLHAAHFAMLIVVSTAFTQWPLSSQLTAWWTGKKPNPLWDVSNDLTGWSELEPLLQARSIDSSIPVLGSRYQTASQAAFALKNTGRVSLVPKSKAEAQEWPYHPSELIDRGPGHWPALRGEVLYVADDRYRLNPQFENSTCKSLGFMGKKRLGFDTKQVQAWICGPDSPSH